MRTHRRHRFWSTTFCSVLASFICVPLSPSVCACACVHMDVRRPLKRIDMLVDMTVYCGLRHRYLARMYDLWQRLLKPGHTIMMISYALSTSQQIPLSASAAQPHGRRVLTHFAVAQLLESRTPGRRLAARCPCRYLSCRYGS